ncbi:MAG TPA: hypothetical protein VN328_02370 [Thermodesulfovibrionales bacterium]|nr:hypothetical protein [Thermodesulfovibrionales bacterium]
MNFVLSSLMIVIILKTGKERPMQTQGSHEYINDFLYFVLRPDEGRGKGMLVYCSGVNISRFFPITKGRHGIGSSPAMRGLQLTNLGVRELALSRGATPRAIRGNDCAGVAPTREIWYTELLAIENAPESFPDEMINYCVINLVEKIFRACLLELQLPDKLPEPADLQELLEAECGKYGG